MKTLNEDIKTGQLKQVYLLFGEEDYLKRQYKNRLTRAILPEGDTMNYSRYEGKNVDITEVIDLAETMPFFAERRLIVLEDTGFFKSGGTELADYLKKMPGTVCFLFVENEVDKRSRLFKAVKEQGRAVELSAQDEFALKRWIASNVKKEKKEISPQTIAYFLSKTGTDMDHISKELEKVFCYALERECITKEDIDAVCVSQITGHIFEMVDAVAQRQQKKALNLYYELLALKEPPMRILYLMSRQYRILYQVRELWEAGYGKNEITSRAGVPSFAAGRYISQAKLLDSEELRKMMEECADVEQRVKTGLLSDTLAVEILIVKNSWRKDHDSDRSK